MSVRKVQGAVWYRLAYRGTGRPPAHILKATHTRRGKNLFRKPRTNWEAPLKPLLHNGGK